MTGSALAMAMAGDAPRPATARLSELFDSHHQRLYRLARRLSQSTDEARDLVQETFLRAARSPDSVPSGAAREEAWLVRVLINIARDGWRRTAVRNRAQAVNVAAPASAGHENAAIARATVWRALSALPPRRRAIVVMYELEGADVSAIAELLGLNPVTVRWHLSRGRRELAKILGGTGGAP
jgi:RNA polymerase sigma-70 factor (ECF subfamily)